MKIERIDKNFLCSKPLANDDMVFFGLESKNIKLYGLIYDKELNKYLRMPEHIAQSISKNVHYLNSYTSGGRIKFKTDSLKIAINVKMLSTNNMSHMTAIGIRGFSLYADNVFYKTFMPPSVILNEENKGFNSEICFYDKKMRDITIYFPLYNEVNSLFIGVDRDSIINNAADYKNKKPMLFYGSSITQGGCASRPGNSYDAILCRYIDSDYINLGFSGSAKGEREIAEYCGSLDVSMFIFDYDHNAPDINHLKNTHYRFYQIYRSLRPDVPIIMLSKPDFENNLEENIKRRKIIKNSFVKARNSGDKNVYFIDGETLFDKKNRCGCTVDGCHPNDLGFQRMAEKVFNKIKTLI